MWSRIDAADRAERLRDVRRARVPRARAGPAARRGGVRAGRAAAASCGLVALDPEAEGETHSPLDFAPLPDSIARRLFDEATIEAHLDHLAGAQRDDGGWMFNWPAWSPAAEADWRGFLTVDALRVLRANGRA